MLRVPALLTGPWRHAVAVYTLPLRREIGSGACPAQRQPRRPHKPSRRPSPLQYAQDQEQVSSRLYASMLSNRRNRWTRVDLNTFLDDWRRRCDDASASDKAVVLTAAAGAAARSGMSKTGADLLDQVPHGQFVPPGALRELLKGSQRDHCCDTARRALTLIKRHCQLTMIDYTSSVLACLDDPLDLVQEALECGLPLDNWATTVFLLACSDIGDEALTDAVWEAAKRQRLALTEKTLGAYLSALGDFGRGEQALTVAQEHATLMNDISTISLLTALSHSNMPDQALEVFHRLHPPTQAHVNCVVDALSRAGRLDEACALLSTAQHSLSEDKHVDAIDDDDEETTQSERQWQRAVGWMTLLGGAVKHVNVPLAEQAAAQVAAISQDRGQRASALTLLSNVHRAAGDEDRATQVHRERLAERLWKEPGRSIVMVGKDRCAFVANGLFSVSVNNKERPIDESMRQRIIARMERWGNMCQHSEKLALAYALEKGVKNPVLYKNLRMCVDCHESTLHITVQEGITVRHRDQNRWHVMKDGVCSCGGYW
eukprot:m.218008 g.218008  ORF g.218008 m.218008 type:complete len:544 (-) comp29406_c0_seq1:152-1783(-)